MNFFDAPIDSGQYTEVTPISRSPQELTSASVSYYLIGTNILIIFVVIVGLAVQIAALKRKLKIVSQVEILEKMWKLTPNKIEGSKD